jgi:hypothetical protein
MTTVTNPVAYTLQSLEGRTYFVRNLFLVFGFGHVQVLERILEAAEYKHPSAQDIPANY